MGQRHLPDHSHGDLVGYEAAARSIGFDSIMRGRPPSEGAGHFVQCRARFEKFKAIAT